ncbi:hypothetical protein [Kitasatospora sp. NPDC059827]|uniref:hypothetical protein n=1 Tax=Kitasatospora sp. NPDC059827 TaxID=3346964 RepID=UPI003653484A
MNSSDPRDGAGAAEDELRVLLHEAVPPLAAPKDRMERVFARAARTRRRRRNAGLGFGLAGGLVAAALAAAPAIAPSPDPAQEAAGRPTATASPLPTATGAPLRFPEVDGLLATLPPGWFSEPVTGAPHQAVGYLANRPFNPNGPCFGLPVPCGASAAQPAPDRVLLTLRLVNAPDTAGQPDGATTGMTETSLDKECSTRNGNRELVGRRSVDLKGPALVEVTACALDPSERTLRQVQQVLDSIRTADR